MAIVPANPEELLKRHQENVEFYHREGQRRQSIQHQFGDPWHVCVNCGWRGRKSYCIANGIRACPQCGSTKCAQQCLEYDTTIPPNPLPTTIKEVEQIERDNRKILGGR